MDGEETMEYCFCLSGYPFVGLLSFVGFPSMSNVDYDLQKRS